MVEASHSQDDTQPTAHDNFQFSQQQSMLDNADEMAAGEPPLEYDPMWRQTFPNRNTFTFENGVRITSEFESGNLWKCQEFLPG